MAIRFKGAKVGITPHPKPSKAANARAKKTRKARPAPQPTGSGLISVGSASTTIDEIRRLQTYTDFRQAGFVLMRRSLDAVLFLIELIGQAEQKLDKDDFERLKLDLSIAKTTALQYITTARSERIRKLRDEDADLPASAHTLYLIASMSDAEYKAFGKAHLISRLLTTEDVRSFRASWKERQELARYPKTTKGAEHEALDEAANEATAPVEEGEDPNEFVGAPEVLTETAQPSAYATWEELATAMLDLKVADIRGSFGQVDPEIAETRFELATRLFNFAEDVHRVISDAQYAIANP